MRTELPREKETAAENRGAYVHNQEQEKLNLKNHWVLPVCGSNHPQ